MMVCYSIITKLNEESSPLLKGDDLLAIPQQNIESFSRGDVRRRHGRQQQTE